MTHAALKPFAHALVAAAVLALPAQGHAASLRQTAEFQAPQAGQAVAADAQYFYAVDNHTIAKYDKRSGKLVKQWDGGKGGPIIHLDSAMIMDGKIYCAHSNYPAWPMTSSLEIFDAQTLEHIGSHSFGIHWGSLTWVDFRDGYWWMGFANYDRPFGPNQSPYGYKANTQIIKFTPDFRMQEAWTLPASILDRLGDMSNSGGGWGPDGYLYLSGHDNAEAYKVQLPQHGGSVMELVETLPMNIRGQGIAWDRGNPKQLWGVIRANKEELAKGIGNKVTAFAWTP